MSIYIIDLNKFMAHFVFGAAISAQPQPSAGTMHSVDVRQFDLAGVKTGMSPKEAVQALAAHFQTPFDQVVSKLELSNPPIDVPGIDKKFHEKLFYKNDTARISIYFAVRIPINKEHPFVVWQVFYQGFVSPAKLPRNYINFYLKGAIEKYGDPSFLGMSETVWCKLRSKIFWMKATTVCTEGSPQLFMSQFDNSTDMTLSDTTLLDPWKRFLDDSKTVKPSF